jgi:hypothetical protein
MPKINMERVRSAWKTIDNKNVYVSSMGEVSEEFKVYYNTEPTLQEPPLSGESGEKQSKTNTTDTTCKSIPYSVQYQSGKAPSKVNYNKDANTVEIVKRDGKYEVVIDGVSQAILSKNKDGSYHKSYNFWMPRFKEARVNNERTIRPLLFSMRLEDFETVPRLCVVKTVQRIVNGNQVLMHDKVIETSNITPYQVNSHNANVTMLPYPLMSTPEPYFTLNDYSKARTNEIQIASHYYSIGLVETVKSAWAAFIQLRIGTATKDSIMAAWKALAQIAFTEAAASIPFPSGILLLAFLNYLPDGEKLSDFELKRVLNRLSVALDDGPIQHKITLDRLTQILYRISQTRANGVIKMKYVDNTIGWSMEDISSVNWKAETAFLNCLIHSGDDRRDYSDKYTGVHTREENKKHVSQFDNALNYSLMGKLTHNTFGRKGLHMSELAKYRTELFYIVRIQEMDGTQGPEIVLRSTLINGLDAGWIASGFDEKFAACKTALQCFLNQDTKGPRLEDESTKNTLFESVFDIDKSYRFIMNDILADDTNLETYWQQAQNTDENTQEYFARCVGIDKNNLNGYLSFRFKNVLPSSHQSEPIVNTNLMKFASFKVPCFNLNNDNTTNLLVVRVMPQIVIISTQVPLRTVALIDDTFVQPTETSEISDSARQFRISIRRTTKMFAELLKTTHISMFSPSHLYQIYQISKSELPIRKHIRETDSLLPDLFALSFIPPIDLFKTMSTVSVAGGTLLEDMIQISSGVNVKGVAALLDSLSLPRDIHAYFSIALFSEISTHHIVEYGFQNINENGFDLERIELVKSALSTALYSAKIIGSYLKNIYGSDTVQTLKLSKDDVAFQCIPGMKHVQRVLNIIETITNKDLYDYKLSCVRIGNALSQLGSNKKIPWQKLPFTPLQSALGTVPIAVRLLDSYKSLLKLHVSATNRSYERMYYFSLACSQMTQTNQIIYLCTDIVFFRPIIMKAFIIQPSSFAAMLYDDSNLASQANWKGPPVHYWNASILKIRLAKLRIDMRSTQKEKSAVNYSSVEITSNIVESELIQDMTNLNVHDLASTSVTNTVANYFIPFGFLDSGSVGDVLHTEFEQHPIWMESLIKTTSSLLVHDDKQVGNMEVKSSNTDNYNRVHNPYIINMTEKYTRVRLYPTLDSNLLPGYIKTKVNYNMASLVQMCDLLNKLDGGELFSGKLSQHYRICMYNTERLFQVILATASKISTKDRSVPIKLHLDIEDIDKFHMPVLVACICIANEMAKTYIGLQSQIIVKDDTQSRSVCTKIQNAADFVCKRGIKAIPFCEICACISLL